MGNRPASRSYQNLGLRKRGGGGEGKSELHLTYGIVMPETFLVCSKAPSLGSLVTCGGYNTLLRRQEINILMSYKRDDAAITVKYKY